MNNDSKIFYACNTLTLEWDWNQGKNVKKISLENEPQQYAMVEDF